MTDKTPHKYNRSGCGYDPADYCEHCHCSNYSTSTLYCEDYREEIEIARQKQLGIHEPTNIAIEKLRSTLTLEEWELLDIKHRLGIPYRIIDRIKV